MRDGEKRAMSKKVAFASYIGSAVEWYDFGIYGTAAALVFGPVFFPNVEPLIGTLAAFATFGIGFVARPLGGVLAGHYGDRIGRKFTLVASLLVMGIATVAIGLMPGYAQIGIWAPILLVLFRLMQGIGLGAEWAGAVLMTTEHAPKERRGLYGSLPQLGGPTGSMLATGSLALTVSLTGEGFETWGWRIPFLASSLLILIGIFIRLRLDDSDEFKSARSSGKLVKAPVVEVVRNHFRPLMLATGLRISDTLLFYIVVLFIVNYATRTVGMSRGEILGGITLALALELITMPLAAALSDKIGRRPIFIFGAISGAILIFPLFFAIDANNVLMTTILLVVIINSAHATTFATSAAMLAELFPTEVRMSGASISFNLASLIAAAPAPMIATSLLTWGGGSSWPVSMYVIAGCLITFVSALIVRETRRASVTLVERQEAVA